MHELENNNVESSDTDTTDKTEILTPTDPKFVIMRAFDQLLPLVPSQETLFSSSLLSLVFRGITHLSNNDMSDISAFLRKKLNSTYKNAMSRSQIETRLSEYLDTDTLWEGRTYVGEKNGQLFVGSEDKPVYISNFILRPLHTIVVDKGHKYHVYDAHVRANDGPPVVKKFMLRASDFDSLGDLQKQIKLQLSGTSARINRCGNYMEEIAYKHIDLAQWEAQKTGTSLIGLERLEDNGPKYFCTPNGIYDLEGNKSKDIVYMGNEEANQEELKNLTNLEYDPNTWKSTAALFLQNILHINEKRSMMSALGWIGAIPHDYVVRKEAGTGFFPHCHIVGEPGSGKTTFMTILKQFMGHNDASPRAFPTPFETAKLLNSSYNIPTVLDEYAKRWRKEHLDDINKILVEAFNRSRWSRGQSNLSSVYYKHKNPLMFGGQIPTSDAALATRIVPIQIFKTFQNTALGKKSVQHLEALQKAPDKNFWVGYNLWCAKYANEEVKSVYEKYRSICRSTSGLDNRVADIYAIVMLGLHFIRSLALELNVDIGYSEDDILSMVNFLASSASEVNPDSISPLEDFLHDLASYAFSMGNNTITGRHFGKGLSVMHVIPEKGPGEYGNKIKQTACIYGKDLVLVKMKEMVDVINKHKGKSGNHSYEEIMTFVESRFRESLEHPVDDSNLVLAPKQYRTRFGLYTAFSRDTLFAEYGDFSDLLKN